MTRMTQYVYVHIWDDNANVYGSFEAALDGIDAGGDERPAITEALNYAFEHPGEPSYIDGGMSTVRYLTITS